MGWEMPEHLAQPPLFRALDDYLNDPVNWKANCHTLMNRLQNLTGGTGLVDVLADPEVKVLIRDRLLPKQWVDQLSPLGRQQAINCHILTPLPNGDCKFDEVEHLRQEWFTPRDKDHPCGWWKKGSGPTEALFINALIELASAKLAREVPVASYWVCAGSDGDPFKQAACPGFRCYVAWTPAQITFLILTPEEPDQPPQVGSRSAHHHAPTPAPSTGKKQEKIDAVGTKPGNGRRTGILVIKPETAGPVPKDIVARAYDLSRN